MNSNLSTRMSARSPQIQVLSMFIVSGLAIVLLVSPIALQVNGSTGSTFDNVQVLIQTQQDLPYSYTLTAYNTTGFQVAYYQSNYAAASLELPAGTYLFTVQASYAPTNYPCIGCVVGGPMIPATSLALLNSTSPSNDTLGTNSTGVTVVPIFRLASSNEYGYAVEQVTGPSNITIVTQNASDIVTTQVSVHVAFANGTSVQGAWVYAAVVDNYYYNQSNVVSSAQTGADGMAVLTMPEAPLLVTSDLSIPISFPQLPSNETVIVGGQKVNVTLYWQPSSITLAGQTLILPPQQTGSITLQYQAQQYYYYPTPYGVSTTPALRGVTNESVSGSASNVSNLNDKGAVLPSFSLSAGQTGSHNTQSTATVSAANELGGESMLVVGAVVLVAFVVALGFSAAVRRRNGQEIVSA